MPANRFTKKAKTRLWDRVYHSEKPRIGKIRAIRAADSVLLRKTGKLKRI